MLAQLLSRERESILERWVRLIVDSYPPQSSEFILQQSDRFQNPIGHTIAAEAGALYDSLLTDDNADRITTALDNLVRMRAVQDFSPAQAVGFVFALKQAIRDRLHEDPTTEVTADEWAAVESRIDRMALVGFDCYMRCRERLCQVRLNEMKRRSHRFMKEFHGLGEAPPQQERDSNDSTFSV